MNSLPRRHGIVSLAFIGEGKVKGLKLEEVTGGVWREKEPGLLTPVICIKIISLNFYCVIHSKFYQQIPRKLFNHKYWIHQKENLKERIYEQLNEKMCSDIHIYEQNPCKTLAWKEFSGWIETVKVNQMRVEIVNTLSSCLLET